MPSAASDPTILLDPKRYIKSLGISHMLLSCSERMSPATLDGNLIHGGSVERLVSLATFCHKASMDVVRGVQDRVYSSEKGSRA